MSSEPLLDDICVTFHSGTGEFVVIKALQQITNIAEEEGHGLVFVVARAQPRHELAS